VRNVEHPHGRLIDAVDLEDQPPGAFAHDRGW
jgi:hypothetical protein